MRRILILSLLASISACATVAATAAVAVETPEVAASHAPPPPCGIVEAPAAPADKAALALSLADCLENPDPALRDDLVRTTYAAYAVELLDKFTADDDKNPALYALLSWRAAMRCFSLARTGAGMSV